LLGGTAVLLHRVNWLPQRNLSHAIIVVVIALPAAVRAWLVEAIERGWKDPAPVVAALPRELPAGQVVALAGGGSYGLRFDGRLDEIEGRLALEVLENSRMAGENYFRIWDDGTVEQLEPAPWIAHAAGQEEEYFAHNRIAYDHLRSRGFLA